MKATIMIPVYNDKRFFQSSLESALAQTYKGDYEILVVNDGSTDKTKEILEDFEKQFPDQIHGINQIHGGGGTARNRLLEESRSEVLVGLDSDDLLHEEALTHIVNIFEEDLRIGFLYSNHQVIDEEGEVTRVRFKEEIHPHLEDVILHCNFPGPVKVFRKSYLGPIRFDPELRRAVDYDFLLKSLTNRNVSTFVTHLPKVLYSYRTNPNSISHTRERNTIRVLERYLSTNKVYGNNEFKVVPVTEQGFTFWDHEINGKRIMKPEAKTALLKYLAD
tara:strand:- start:45535 stop:46362 length:828 start_codon:yes stop_codon:yes gene_type:complete